LGSQYKSLAEGDDVLSVGLNRAVILLAEPSKGRFGHGGAPAGKLLGEHPDDKKSVTLNKGRYGPYVKWGKVMATVTKDYDPENLTLPQALEIIAAKIAKGPSKGFGGKGKKATKEPAKEKAPAKPASKKPTKPKKV
jgi:DNA topoisomerase-1